MATARYGVGVTGSESEKQQCDCVVPDEVAARQEDDQKRRLMVRLAMDVIAVLQRHITVAQLDARTRPLSGQRWRMRTAAGGAATCRRPSVHRGVGMAAAELGKAARRSK
jgi:hypothetical protein